jgi:hypothetical protein
MNGEITAIEACWSLCGFAADRIQLVSEADRNLFIAVQSETDALPVGPLKANWHPDFLPAKLDELNRFEAKISGKVREACGRLAVALRAAGVELQ